MYNWLYWWVDIIQEEEQEDEGCEEDGVWLLHQ